jgi:hypothetical protein
MWNLLAGNLLVTERQSQLQALDSFENNEAAFGCSFAG